MEGPMMKSEEKYPNELQIGGRRETFLGIERRE